MYFRELLFQDSIKSVGSLSLSLIKCMSKERDRFMYIAFVIPDGGSDLNNMKTNNQKPVNQ